MTTPLPPQAYSTIAIGTVKNVQIFQKSRRHLKILGTGMVTWSRFQTDDPQVLGTTVHYVFTRATWHMEFMQALSVVIIYSM